MPGKKISCYVYVRGEASEEEDQGVQGLYQVQLDFPQAGEYLTAEQKAAGADAALDAFHNKQGIEYLDDFEIDVYLDTGEVLDVEAVEGIDVKATYLDKIDEVDCPAALIPLLAVADAKISSSPAP